MPSSITLRDHYTAQEDQAPDFAVPYTDFGARQYNTALRRWMTPDPLSEKYYGISPYAFCNNSPMVFVDRDGRDIVLYGQNNSSVAILTPDFDFQYDLSSLNINWGGSYYFEGQEYLQIGLDIIGIFDPTGISDIANASIYFRNRQFGNVAVSVVGLLPYVGDAAKTTRVAKGLDAIVSSIKLHRHHIVPKAIYNQFEGLFDIVSRDSIDNLKLVPAGFHGNHPSYTKWVHKKLSTLQENGNLTYDKFMAFKNEAITEINNALKAWENTGENMNTYFDKLLNK